MENQVKKPPVAVRLYNQLNGDIISAQRKIRHAFLTHVKAVSAPFETAMNDRAAKADYFLLRSNTKKQLEKTHGCADCGNR
jgi:hypothetical protein